jgi:DNA-binding protein HU-beta
VNKSEFVAAIAKRSGSTQADAAAFLEAALLEIQSTLAGGGEVAITGFGKFSTSDRAARTGRNPQTGAAIKIAAATLPKFSAGAVLKAAVAKKKKKK